MQDIIIIGAGVIGCSISRELSKYDLNILVLEKEEDVASGTTKANSAIIHAGYDAAPGTLKADLNFKGNLLFDDLSKELDFPFKRVGSFVVCFSEDEVEKLKELMEQGKKNGIKNIKILSGEKAKELEPNLSEEVKWVLYAPTAGIVCPYEMTIAYAENAYENGVEFNFNTKVLNIEKDNKGFILHTNKGIFKSKIIINAAGVYSDEINNMICSKKISIIPRKGEYCLFDKEAGQEFNKVIFQLPSEKGKGVLVTPTVDGNLLIGPNAVDGDNKEDVDTTKEGITEILDKAKKSVKKVPLKNLITSFTGLRAHGTENDFIIKEGDVSDFFNVAAIESPGLSSAPAIASFVEEMIIKKTNPNKKENFNPYRKGIVKFRELSNDERNKIIKKSPSYGKIVCRCELVTEGEIIDSIRRPLGAKTIDGVKRRTRAGMGRCQAGFCTPRILNILSRELKLKKTQITKFGGDSNLLVGEGKNL